jgi:hypothetical protein
VGRSVLQSLHPEQCIGDGELTLDPAALPVRPNHPTHRGEVGLYAAAADRQSAGAERGGRDKNTGSIKLHQQHRQKETVGFGHCERASASSSTKYSVEDAFDAIDALGNGRSREGYGKTTG